MSSIEKLTDADVDKLEREDDASDYSSVIFLSEDEEETNDTTNENYLSLTVDDSLRDNSMRDNSMRDAAVVQQVVVEEEIVTTNVSRGNKTTPAAPAAVDFNFAPVRVVEVATKSTQTEEADFATSQESSVSTVVVPRRLRSSIGQIINSESRHHSSPANSTIVHNFKLPNNPTQNLTQNNASNSQITEKDSSEERSQSVRRTWKETRTYKNNRVEPYKNQSRRNYHRNHDDNDSWKKNYYRNPYNQNYRRRNNFCGNNYYYNKYGEWVCDRYNPNQYYGYNSYNNRSNHSLGVYTKGFKNRLFNNFVTFMNNVFSYDPYTYYDRY
ncbi:hypothetical protein TKK_0017758 [Trichogramma kaykai]|uniref:Uncharacterized protein n=1 Tax=Trichogramma kaykai TaxID=54128 RepID=A0ABD2W2Z1_9HYME